MVQDETLWTVTDVAQYLNVSESWVYHRATSGELPSIRIGRLRRFKPALIRALNDSEQSIPPARVLSIVRRPAK